MESCRRRRIVDCDLPHVLDFLESYQNYQGLNLAYNSITDIGLELIITFLKDNKHLKSLNIMCNDITSYGIKKLTDMGNDLALHSLRLNGNKFGPEGGRSLALLLVGNHNLTHLDVGETDQTMSSLEFIAGALHSKQASVRVLDLSRPLGPYMHVFDSQHFADILGQALQLNTSLTELYLQKSHLGCHDMRSLVHGLASNNSLLLLDLSCNLIADDGADHLASYLGRGPRLRGLMLSHNCISDAGASNLGFGMPYSRLWLLDVAHNRMTDTGILRLLHTLKKAFYSRALYIWGNYITHLSCKVIRRMLRSKVLDQDFLDVQIYTVDGKDHVAYHHVDRYRAIYYCVVNPLVDPAHAHRQQEVDNNFQSNVVYRDPVASRKEFKDELLGDGFWHLPVSSVGQQHGEDMHLQDGVSLRVETGEDSTGGATSDGIVPNNREKCETLLCKDMEQSSRGTAWNNENSQTILQYGLDLVKQSCGNTSCNSLESRGFSATTQNTNACKSNQGKIYSCILCPSKFTNRLDLSMHMFTHKEGKLYTCKLCPSKFSYSSNLKRHIRCHTGEKPYACKLCPSKYSNISNLSTHMRFHSGEKPFVCTSCPAKFSRSTNLKLHVRTHTGEKPYKCTSCPAKFTQSSALRTHLATHTSEKPYSCAMCTSSFITKGSLVSHIYKHLGEKPYACKLCPSKYSNKSNLSTHMRLHSGEKPFVCTSCPAKFSRSTNLKLHVRTHTGEKPYKCTSCLAKFTQSSALRTHLATHTSEKPYSCAMCTSSFITKGNLVSHIYKHLGEKPFSCKICPAKFVDGSSLTKHTRVHTGEESYVCEICPAKFFDKSCVKKHMRKHTGEKDFSCTLCTAKFTSSLSVRKHMLIHSGQKPFTCTVCSATFICSSSVRRHFRKHTGEKPFTCKVCPARFKDSSSLLRHSCKHTDDKLS